MRANQRRQLNIDNLSPRELNGAEWEKRRFLNERGAGMIAASYVAGRVIRMLYLQLLLECRQTPRLTGTIRVLLISLH